MREGQVRVGRVGRKKINTGDVHTIHMKATGKRGEYVQCPVRHFARAGTTGAGTAPLDWVLCSACRQGGSIL